MDPQNNANWNNDSGSLLESLNGTAQQTNHFDTRRVFIQSVYFFVVVVLGLPGNLLVIVVYIGKTTNSTKVYLLALAVSDAALCIGCIVLTKVAITLTTLYVILCFVDTAITFSIYLLAFVSIERLLAVWRPHSFKLGAMRAKIAISIIAAFASVVGVVMTISRMRHYKLLSRLFPMFVTFTGVIIMTICYTMVAVKQLKKARAARMNIGIQSGAQTLAAGPATVSQSCNATNIGKVGSSQPIKKLSAKDAKTYKGVTLLFIVTVVCIACWLPQWLAYVGLRLNTELRRVFVITFAVNPFIYGVASSVFRNDVKVFCRKTASLFTDRHR